MGKEHGQCAMTVCDILPLNLQIYPKWINQFFLSLYLMGDGALVQYHLDFDSRQLNKTDIVVVCSSRLWLHVITFSDWSLKSRHFSRTPRGAACTQPHDRLTYFAPRSALCPSSFLFLLPANQISLYVHHYYHSRDEWSISPSNRSETSPISSRRNGVACYQMISSYWRGKSDDCLGACAVSDRWNQRTGLSTEYPPSIFLPSNLH